MNGEGSAELVPDMALLQLSVTRDADTARQALDANSAAMAQVIKALREQGIAERDIQTVEFRYPAQVCLSPAQSPGRA